LAAGFPLDLQLTLSRWPRSGTSEQASTGILSKAKAPSNN